MAKKIVHLRDIIQGYTLCRHQITSNMAVVDKAPSPDDSQRLCVKCMTRSKRSRSAGKIIQDALKTTPVPAIPHPTDWRWPLDSEKLESEMNCRRITLYSYYRGEYCRRIIWHPGSGQIEVRCEGEKFIFTDINQALERYNDEKVYS